MADIELNSSRFRREREADWQRLEAIIDRAEKRGVRVLDEADMLDLPRLYRSTVSSLSVARSISLDQNLVSYLETLCSRAYFFVYGTRTNLYQKVTAYFRYDWPNAVRGAWIATLLSCLCLFGGALAAYLLVMQNSDWFYAFMPGGLADGRTPGATTEYLESTLYDDGRSAAERLTAFASFLFSHNSRIAIFAFALGFAFGVPTAALLFYNGLTLGAFVALFKSRDLGFEVMGWLLIHGVTELFAIILAGTAGFMIGGAIAFPGQMSRLDAASERGRQAAHVVVGTVIMLMFAAVLEGFGRQLIQSDLIRYLIAATSLIFWCAYFYLPRRTAP